MYPQTEQVNRSPRRLIIALVSVILSAAMVFASVADSVDDVVILASTYISDLQIFSGSSLSAAISACKKAGFTPVEKNINRWEEDDEDEGIYVIGYKTTSEREDSITGLSLLQMNAGYSDFSYGQIAEKEIARLGNLPDELMKSVTEFGKNYRTGSPAAKVAADILNCLYIDEMNNTGLGDYLLGGNCDVAFIKKLLARSSKSVVAALCNALVPGVAEYGDDKWAARVSGYGDMIAELEGDGDVSGYDIKYNAIASELVDPLQSFASRFHTAELNYAENGNRAELPDERSGNPTEIPDKLFEDIYAGGEVDVDDGDIFYLYAYDVLNGYAYDGETKLGDYIVSLGDMNYTTKEDMRAIYPLVRALTDGQIATVRLSGIAFAAIYLVNDGEITEKANTQLDVIKPKIKDYNGGESVSVWEGTDQTVYEKKVALTEEAMRANSAGQIYDSLTNPDKIDRALSEIMTMLEMASAVIGIAYGVTVLTTSLLAHFAGFAVWGVASSAWAICAAGIGSGVIGTIFGLLGCAAIALSYIVFAAMIIALVAIFIKFIYDYFVDGDDEEFTPIPEVIYDSQNGNYIKYEAVCSGGKPANINGNEAKRWNALYLSRSTRLGDPICSDELNDLIVVKYGNSSVPSGYTAVKNFGELSPANLNANTDEDAQSIFMFVKKNPVNINDGETVDGDRYISKLSLSVEDTETAAKAELTKTGYSVIDVNLTPLSGKYSSLGYIVTTDADAAIRDIRVSAKDSSASIVFGNASYTSCGTTPVGDTVYYTSYSSAGSPILADIQVREKLGDVPAGYEPVNMFCGGNAFNFNVGNDEDTATEYAHWNDKGRYLYFKPSVSFTSGTEYLSGFVIVAGKTSKEGRDSVADYASALGLKVYDYDLTGGLAADTVKDVGGGQVMTSRFENIETKICYSTTYNPYRAIYGVRSYTSTPMCSSVPTSFGSIGNGAYASVGVFFELPYFCAGRSPLSDYSRGIYHNHSYTFPSCSGEGSGLLQMSAYLELLPEDCESVGWEKSSLRGKGLYVLGPTEGKAPLTPDDIIVTSKAETVDGFCTVRDVKTPNRAEPHNLGFFVKGSPKGNVPVYMYVREEKPVEKTYISSIYVSSFEIGKYVKDPGSLTGAEKQRIEWMGSELCMQMLSTCCDSEIKQANIAVSPGDDVFRNASTQNVNCSYIGVSRTNLAKDAITSIIRYVTKDKNAPATIEVGGVTYTRAGDMINDAKGSYYLYYTTSLASNPGCPLTSISVSGAVYDGESLTALSLKEGENGLKGDPNSSVYIHMGFDDKKTVMSTIYVGHGKSENEAKMDLLTLGCTVCIDMDLNKGAGGEYVYIGYSRYAPSSAETRRGRYSYALYDIMLTVGKEHVSQFEYNGAVYRCARDDYSVADNPDPTKGVSLNVGTSGKPIYVYYSWTKTDAAPDPIERLGVACRDYAMIETDERRWENVLSDTGKLLNLNDGVIKTVDDGKHITDIRMYMYASRMNGTVKSGAGISGYIMSSTFTECNVYIKGK
ncbi:MAG: hypothetical protein KBT31_02630 [Firmicutes bacterium]|nr:hypothetical protein [Candidatus Colimorpha enterica]